MRKLKESIFRKFQLKSSQTTINAYMHVSKSSSTLQFNYNICMNLYSTSIIKFSSFALLIGSVITAPSVSSAISVAMLIGAGALIHFGLDEKQAQFRFCIGLLISCLLLALFAGWAESDSMKTFNDATLRQNLQISVGASAASDFFIAQAASAKYMSIIKSAALFDMFTLAIYSAFLAKK